MAQLQITLPEGGQLTHDVTDDRMTIGRLADNGFQIDHGSVSSHHAEITGEEGIFRVRDLGSTNGTFVNDERVEESVLKNNDSIRFGAVEGKFLQEVPDAEQPLPESTIAEAAPAKASTRPESFVSSSPLPKEQKTRDPVGVALVVAAVLAFVAFLAAGVLALQMSAPV